MSSPNCNHATGALVVQGFRGAIWFKFATGAHAEGLICNDLGTGSWPRAHPKKRGKKNPLNFDWIHTSQLTFLESSDVMMEQQANVGCATV